VAPEYMIGDQRFAARRADVLTYRGPLLETPVTVAGPVPVRLRVGTAGGDADWVVKLVDEYPGEPGAPETQAPMGGGYQQLVRADVMRGKFRNSLERPEPFTPGEPAAVDFTLNDVCHTFRRGHRIVVQVQSSWFPLVDRNPQVFEDIYHAKASDFRAREHTVYRNPQHPSCLVLPLLED
jgi:putative CocE/NonD family hydrolase